MNLKRKLLYSAVGPLLIVGVITIVAMAFNLPTITARNMESGFQATALSINELFNRQSGDYIKKIDQVWKGTMNITSEQEMFKEIKESTGMDIIFFWDNTSTATSICDKDGKILTGIKLDEKIATTVVKKGNPYFGKNIKIDGNRYYGYVLPVRQELTDAVIGMLFVGRPRAAVNTTMYGIMALLIGIVLVVSGISGYFVYRFSKHISDAIQTDIEAAGRLSRGDLTVELPEEALKRTDELGVLAGAIMSITRGLINIVGQAKYCTESLSEASDNLKSLSDTTAQDMSIITTATHDIAQATGHQAMETERAHTNMNIISEVITDAGVNVAELNTSATSMQAKSHEAKEILKALHDSNEDVRNAVDTIYEQTVTTNRSAQSIDEAVSIIANIATQTNLLSLNASIEAARAGEAGRGFSVVASEIKNLAEQSNASASSIKKVVEALRNDSNHAVETMDSMKNVILEQNNRVDQTVSIFDEVGEHIENTVETSHKITEQVTRLEHARVEVTEVLENLAGSAEQNAASAQQTSASMASVSDAVSNVSGSATLLGSMFTKLNSTLAVFKLEQSDASETTETTEEVASLEQITVDTDLSQQTEEPHNEASESEIEAQ